MLQLLRTNPPPPPSPSFCPQVLERYADVDPADYRAVRDRETEARSDAAAARAQLQQAAMDAAEQEKTHLAAHAAKEEELSTVRAAKSASEKSAEMLRTKLRQLKGLQEVCWRVLYVCWVSSWRGIATCCVFTVF